MSQTIFKGDKVETTGTGRVVCWPRTVGTVVLVTKRSVFVQWDNSIVEDELRHDEVRKIGESDAVVAGLKTWALNRCYLDNNGNYRLKQHGRPIAPWNKAVKERFPDSSALHEAAQAYKRPVREVAP